MEFVVIISLHKRVGHLVGVPAHNNGAGVFNYCLESRSGQQVGKIRRKTLGAAVAVVDKAVQRHSHAGDYFSHNEPFMLGVLGMITL